MAIYEYTSIDLEGPAFRLVRLFKGRSTDTIQCELFEAWLHDIEDGIPYEAVSYTWGSCVEDNNYVRGNCGAAL
jgi:hypothetical protein